MKPVKSCKKQRGFVLELLAVSVILVVTAYEGIKAGLEVIESQHTTNAVFRNTEDNVPVSDAQYNTALNSTSQQLQSAAQAGNVINSIDAPLNVESAAGTVFSVYAGAGTSDMVNAGSKPVPTSSNPLPADVVTPPGPRVFSGAFSNTGIFDQVDTQTGVTLHCTYSVTYSGTITLSVSSQANQTYTGSVTVTGHATSTATGGGGTGPNGTLTCTGGVLPENGSVGVAGTLPSVAWAAGDYSFSGTLSGNAVSGTMTETNSTATGSASGAVVLSN
jgi:hypothetical protein